MLAPMLTLINISRHFKKSICSNVFNFEEKKHTRHVHFFMCIELIKFYRIRKSSSVMIFKIFSTKSPEKSKLKET